MVISGRGSRAVDILLVFLAAFFCAGTIWAQLPRPAEKTPATRETFNPALGSITTIDGAANYVRAHAGSNRPEALANAADQFVRERFYHSYSFFDPGHDWIAYLSGFAWINLRSPVLPENILDFPEAACSQQVIVFQAIARKLGFDAGVVTLRHHMIAAVKIDGQWQVYDADRDIAPRSYPLAKLLAGDPAVIGIYGRMGRSIDMAGQAARGEIKLVDVNSNPAPQASLFHRLTHGFSHYGWALFLGLALLRLASRRQASSRLRKQPLPV
ncbi:MAG TPA: hypothetical protein VNR86_08280 [Sphingomicrobium sp.]|nr:hypothetical protein [Sphingomicrobium sp.]